MKAFFEHSLYAFVAWTSLSDNKLKYLFLFRSFLVSWFFKFRGWLCITKANFQNNICSLNLKIVFSISRLLFVSFSWLYFFSINFSCMKAWLVYIIPRPVKFTLRIKKFVEKMNQFPADTEILEWYLNF